MKRLVVFFALCLLSTNLANAQESVFSGKAKIVKEKDIMEVEKDIMEVEKDIMEVEKDIMEVEKDIMEVEKTKINLESDNLPEEFYSRHGLTLSNISNIDNNYKLSFHIGFGYEFSISSFYSLQPEAIFSRQGSTDVIDGIRIRNRLNYINFPVVSRFFLTPRLSLDIAPQLGLLVSARIKTKGDKNNRNIKILSSENFNTAEFGVGLGATYKICKDTHIMFRYTQGLTNVYKKSYIGDKNTRNSTFELSFIFR